MSAAIREILEGEGIAVRTGAECIALEKGPSGVRVKVDCREGSPAVDGTHLLLAVGRRPNTDDLGLEKAGVAVDARGYITVDDELRTTVPGIWALGDCNGRGAFTHTAYNDFEIVAANLLDGDPRRVSDRIEAYALYIDPPLGRAGMTETAARKSGKRILVGQAADGARQTCRREGRDAGIHEDRRRRGDRSRSWARRSSASAATRSSTRILDVMYAKAPYTVVQRAMHIHPTVSEYLPTVLGDLREA